VLEFILDLQFAVLALEVLGDGLVVVLEGTQGAALVVLLQLG